MSDSPLALKLTRLLCEAFLLLLVLLALYLALSLMTYHRTDPGWSLGSAVNRPDWAAPTSHVANAGGRVGAWLADFLLYLFGFSAGWFVVVLGWVAWRGYRYLKLEPGSTGAKKTMSPVPQHWFVLMGLGFLLMVVSSAGLEAMRLAGLHFELPLQSMGEGTCSGGGGVLGCELASWAIQGVGLSGAVMFLLLAWALGFSLMTGISWLRLAESLGETCETFFRRLNSKRSAAIDRRVGRRAGEQRQTLVQEARKLQEDHEPLQVLPVITQIEPSMQAVRERQVLLFNDLPNSVLPPLSLLDEANAVRESVSQELLEFTSRQIERKLADFNVSVKVLAALPGPVITRYEIEPAVGVKGSQIINLVKDLARALTVGNIRVVESIPGKNCMGLEIPNARRETVRLSEILGAAVYGDMASPLTLALGKDIAGNPVVVDLAKMPHLLVAGTTGSGKSVAINAMILSLLYKATPQQVRLVLVDPKMLELSVYDEIPHLLAPVVVDMKEAAHALNWCVAEMDRRYKLMSQLGVRNLSTANQKINEAFLKGQPLMNPLSLTPDAPEPLEPMPFIVVVIDELADLMMVVGKKVEELIARIAQKARAAGIHLILATQRPSVDVITGLIKANIPTRISFQVSSRVDSRTILDQMGAEALLGQGDMLYMPTGAGYPHRLHGAFVSDDEVHQVVHYLKAQGKPAYVEGMLQGIEEGMDPETAPGQSTGEQDPLYDQAVALVLETRRASISQVQRHLRIGYNRAARLIEDMEKAGLVSSMATNGSRDVLVGGGRE